jgi:hypothetical protein
MDRDVCLVTPLIQTPAVKRGDHKPPTYEHGESTFAGADYKRKRRLSGAAPTVSASLPQYGSRPTVCTR